MPAYYRRGLQWTRTSYLPAPTGGWNPDANWWELPDNQAPVLDNWILRPGKIVSRGPIVKIASLNLSGGDGNPIAPIGYNFGDTTQPTLNPSGVMNLWFKNDDNTGKYIDPWFAPLLNAPAANLAQGSLIQQQASLDSTALQSHTLVSRDVIGGPRWINFNGLFYGISYDAVAAAVHDTNSTYNIPPLNLLSMPVVQTAAAQMTAGVGTHGEWFTTAGSDDATVGTVTWTSPNNITLSSIGSPATVTLNQGQQSHYLKATFGTHTVPAGATITGIKVLINGKGNQQNWIQDASVKLVKGGVISGTDHADALGFGWDTGYANDPGSDNPSASFRSYGGPNDLWGLTLAPADINASTFGVVFSVTAPFGGPATASAISVWMAVYYTVDSLSVPTVLSGAPHGSFDLKGYLSRIWVLGGVDTPGALTVHEPATLYYTDPIGGFGGGGAALGSPLGSLTTDWKDPVSNVSNKLTMDSNFEDFGVGLALVPNAMLVFRRNSVWRLTGTTSQTFVLKPMSREVGCIDARSIVETDKGVFWLSMRGLMFTDGSSIKNVSGSVQQDLLSAIVQAQAVLQQSSNSNKGSAFATTQLTSKGTVLVSLGYMLSSADVNAAVLTPTWMGMYDPSTGAWTRHTSRVWVGGTPVLLAGRSGRQQIYSVGDYTYSVGGFNQPCPVVQLENFAYTDSSTWGSSFLNPVFGSQNSLEDVDKTTLDNRSAYKRFSIPLRWVTKLIPFDVSHKNALSKRWFLDYVFFLSGGGSSQYTIVFDVFSAQNGSKNINLLIPSSAAPANPNAGLGLHVQQASSPQVSRLSRESLYEIDDLYFVLQVPDYGNTGSIHKGINSGGLGLGVIELYGVGIDYQITRDADGTDAGF